MPEDSIVTWREVDGIAVISIKSSGDESNTWILQQTMRTLLQKEYNRFVIDLSDCSYLASSSWGIIAAVAESAANAGGGVSLCHVDATLREIISVIHLDDKLRICETLKEALHGDRELELTAGA